MKEFDSFHPDRTYWFHQAVPCECVCHGPPSHAARVVKKFARGILKKLSADANHFIFEGFPEDEDKRHTFYVPISMQAIIKVA